MLEKLEAVELAYRERCAELDIDPEQEEATTIDPNLSLEAMRQRLATRILQLQKVAEADTRPPIFRS